MNDPIIKKEFPPNIDQIREQFPLSGTEIFAWDGIIYSPGNGEITIPLIEHEKIHFKQQNGDPESWWEKYLVDPVFRMEQELEAHRAEYRAFCKLHKNRNRRSRYLFNIAMRLASPLYGNLLTHKDAMKKIKS
jgi:hypothetical protein